MTDNVVELDNRKKNEIPNYNPFTRLKKSSKLKDLTDVQLITDYQRLLKDGKDVSVQLEELLSRHNGMLCMLANYMTKRYGKHFTYNDHLQNAFIGAINSFQTWDATKTNSSKVSTYIYKIVQTYLLTAIDEQAAVHCPNPVRNARGYFQGLYDNYPEKKKKIEENLGWKTQDDIENARKKFRLVSEEIWSLDFSYNNDDAKSSDVTLQEYIQSDELNENSIVSSLEFNRACEKLTPRQRNVVRYHYLENYTTSETAALLNVREGQVRGDKATIEKKLRQHYNI